MNLPISRNSNLVIQETGEDLLIYDLDRQRAFCLNKAAGLVFQLCDGKLTADEISHLVNRDLQTNVSDDFVRLAISDLSRNGLLDRSGADFLPLSGQTRREMVKKIGLASMAVLPVIVTIAAPSAAAAQSSGGVLLSACVSPAGCGSGLTCRTCSGGSCSGTDVCCASGGGSGGPNSPITCVPQSNCGSLASQCCSHTTSWTANPCSPTPASGICSCV